jgi:hypothetical protein
MKTPRGGHPNPYKGQKRDPMIAAKMLAARLAK